MQTFPGFTAKASIYKSATQYRVSSLRCLGNVEKILPQGWPIWLCPPEPYQCCLEYTLLAPVPPRGDPIFLCLSSVTRFYFPCFGPPPPCPPAIRSGSLQPADRTNVHGWL
jgi:hypothetical protein